MPLEHSKSNEARSRNIGREIHAGKSPAQAAAIAYSIQRQALRGGHDGHNGLKGPHRNIRSK